MTRSDIQSSLLEGEFLIKLTDGTEAAEGHILAPLFPVQFSPVCSGIGRDTGAVCAGSAPRNIRHQNLFLLSIWGPKGTMLV